MCLNASGGRLVTGCLVGCGVPDALRSQLKASSSPAYPGHPDNQNPVTDNMAKGNTKLYTSVIITVMFIRAYSIVSTFPPLAHFLKLL